MTNSLFKGTGVALVTPFKFDGSVDYNALELVIEHVIKGGVDFLVALGTTAETPTLTEEERQLVLTKVVAACNGRMPVVCGIGGNSTAEVIHAMNTYDLAGVDAILSVSPYYNRPSQEGIYQHYKTVALRAPKPVILYNVPGRTGSNVLPTTILRLAADCSNIIGVKDACGSIVQNMELLQNKPEGLLVLSGDDNLSLAQMAIGMDGVISVAANCFTKDFTDIINYALAGKFDKARKLQYKLLTGMDMLFAEGSPAGVKCVLSHMGLLKNILRLPVTPVSDSLSKKIKEFLQSI